MSLLRNKGKHTKGIYWRRNWNPKRQLAGLRNRYYFAYAGRDVVNQVAKVAPGVIKAAANHINNIAKERINQIIKHHLDYSVILENNSLIKWKERYVKIPFIDNQLFYL